MHTIFLKSTVIFKNISIKFNTHTHTHTHTRVVWAKYLVYFIWVWATFLFGRKKSFRPKFQSHLITIYVCLIAYRKRLEVEGIVI